MILNGNKFIFGIVFLINNKNYKLFFIELKLFINNKLKIKL